MTVIGQSASITVNVQTLANVMILNRKDDSRVQRDFNLLVRSTVSYWVCDLRSRVLNLFNHE